MVADTYSIGEASLLTGTSASTLRYYDQLGLVRPAARVSGRRRYDDAGLHRARLVAALQRAGFTLDEIGRLLDGGDDWRPLAAAKAAELDRRVDELQRARALVTAALSCDCEHLESCGRMTHATGRSRDQSSSSTRSPTESTMREGR